MKAVAAAFFACFLHISGSFPLPGGGAAVSFTHNQSSANRSRLLLNASSKVSVDVYYETLCPTCQYFIRNFLLQLLLDPELFSMISLRMYPSGHSEVSALGDTRYHFQCQHGFEECVGNKIHTCALSMYETWESLELFVCMAQNSQATIEDAATVCLQHYGHDVDVMNECLRSQDTKDAMYEVAQKTKSLALPYVPWVMINDSHSLKAETGGFIRELCSVVQRAGGRSTLCTTEELAYSPKSGSLNGTMAPCFAGKPGSVDAEEIYRALPVQLEHPTVLPS